MRTNKFFVKNRAITQRDIHGERVEHDPMYCMIFFPDQRDGLLLKFVELGIAVIHKRYSLGTEHRVFGLLRRINDNDIRLFAVLWWICQETAILNAVEAEYDHKGMFGAEDTNHFRSFVGKIRQFVDMIKQFVYDPTNIMETIEKFVTAVRVEYTIGPL